VDTNAYSVPWRLIGETVRIVVAGGRVSIRHAGHEVAVHPETTGRRQRVVEPAHFAGVVSGSRATPQPVTAATAPELLRPLSEYERLAGGAW
jgi:hypothetical protein